MKENIFFNFYIYILIYVNLQYIGDQICWISTPGASISQSHLKKTEMLRKKKLFILT